ncbi:hypothetical protein bAD24_p01885 (plasmid) [Burkholderia sp. AD24]|nr:hypothetical protein bAD24_p01885 [Burkholderia sp. AD24]
MNLPVELDRSPKRSANAAAVREDAQGYQPFAAAVSYAQSLQVAIPFSIRVTDRRTYAVVHEVAYALDMLEESARWSGFELSLDTGRVTRDIARAMRGRRPDAPPVQLTLAVSNLSPEFTGHEAVSNVWLRRCDATPHVEPTAIRFSFTDRPLGKWPDGMPTVLSSHRAERTYVGLGTDAARDEMPVFFDCDGYLQGPQEGVLVAFMDERIVCVSSFHPVFAHAAARRLELPQRPAATRLHLSELAQALSFGWVTPDFRLVDAALFSQGGCDAQAETARASDVLPFPTLGEVETDNDICILIQGEGDL